MTSAPSEKRQWVPPPSSFALHADDKMQIETLNDLTYLSVRFKPLQTEPFRLKTDGVNGRAIMQWDTDAPFGFISKPKVALEKVTIRFVSSGAVNRRNATSEHVCSAGKAMFVAFEDMVEQEASTGFRALAGSVEFAALMACYVALEGTDEQPFPQFQPVVDVVSAPLRAFRHNFQLVFTQLRSGHGGDVTVDLLEELMMYQFLTAWPRSPHQEKEAAASRPSWQVRRAMDYIEANLHRKITLSEVASIAHCGVRSLQLSFQKELGKTPVQWMLERRMHKVRNDLLSESYRGEDIAAIARRWGFIHMSDFSRRYRNLFGIRPSQTRSDA